jgi:serine/threonine-protein kinase
MLPRRPTERLGDYDLVRELGEGGFGTVYEARKQRIDKPVALKVLHPHLVKDAEIVGRFQREARAAARFRHPHIVSVADVGEAGGAHFIEMELLDGESLKSRLTREGRLSARDAVDVLVPVCSAASAVHDEGIVHRDLKPANVFLTEPLPGVVHPKLLDFGIAKLRDTSRELTESDAFLGSVSYMAPEQMYDAKSADARSDQWSLAVMAYECLTGRLPFRASSVPEAVTAVLSGRFPKPRELNPEIPAALEDAILRAMEREPERRHTSVKDFGALLLPFASARVRETYATSFPCAETAPAPVTLAPPQEAIETSSVRESLAPPPKRSPRVVVSVSAALTLLAVLGAAWRFTAQRAPSTSARPVTVAVRDVPVPARAPVVVAERSAETDAAPPPAPIAESVPAALPTATTRAHRTTRTRPSRSNEPAVDAGVAIGSRGVTIL